MHRKTSTFLPSEIKLCRLFTLNLAALWRPQWCFFGEANAEWGAPWAAGDAAMTTRKLLLRPNKKAEEGKDKQHHCRHCKSLSKGRGVQSYITSMTLLRGNVCLPHLERDTNIAVNVLSRWRLRTKNGPNMAMLIFRSRGTSLISLALQTYYMEDPHPIVRIIFPPRKCASEERRRGRGRRPSDVNLTTAVAAAPPVPPRHRAACRWGKKSVCCENWVLV